MFLPLLFFSDYRVGSLGVQDHQLFDIFSPKSHGNKNLRNGVTLLDSSLLTAINKLGRAYEFDYKKHPVMASTYLYQNH